MWRNCLAAIILLLCGTTAAQADFIISSAIVEFTKDGPSQQDVDIISRSKDNEYLSVDVVEVVNPGMPQESRRTIDDSAQSGLLVTPDKMILDGGNRKVLRLVLLNPPDDKEHVYRVAIKPVIKGVDNSSKVGLKILVGYEILVIVRPAAMQVQYQAARRGKIFSAINTGNTDVIFQNGKQCETGDTNCKTPNGLRVYPGTTAQVELPFDQPVLYAIWDGKDTVEKTY